MLREDKYFQSLGEEELWQRYCGFFDLSLDEYMEIQGGLLMEEVELVADSVLGKKVMGGKKPSSVEEFRRLVPLTTYDDYEPYLSERQEDVLAVKPVLWCHSAGRGGTFKWIPYSAGALEKPYYISNLILAAATGKGEVNIKPKERILLNLPARPYASGSLFHYLNQVFPIHSIPPQEEAEEVDFQERIETGFRMALRSGVDEILSMSSIMVKIGERMAGQAQGMKFSLSMLHPRVLLTITRALLRSKLARRPMLPRDLWSPKAIITAGTDTSIYKEDIAYYWGKSPFEIYGSTEAPSIAVQNWNKKWLTFVPTCAF